MAVKKIKVKSNAPIYSIGVTWIIFSLFFNMYRISDFLLAAAISAAVYAILYYSVPDKTIQIEEPDFIKTGDKLADDIVENGNKMLVKLLKLSNSISAEPLKSDIRRLHKTGVSIYDYISKNPDSAPLIKKFNDYYFPETLKIISAYDDIDDFEVEGKNIIETKTKIEAAVKSMLTAFNKQLDNLLYDKTFDVRTDITVLETLLAEEGLSGKRIDEYEENK